MTLPTTTPIEADCHCPEPGTQSASQPSDRLPTIGRELYRQRHRRSNGDGCSSVHRSISRSFHRHTRDSPWLRLAYSWFRVSPGRIYSTTSVAGSVLNDLWCEAARLGVTLNGVRGSGRTYSERVQSICSSRRGHPNRACVRRTLLGAGRTASEAEGSPEHRVAVVRLPALRCRSRSRSVSLLAVISASPRRSRLAAVSRLRPCG